MGDKDKKKAKISTNKKKEGAVNQDGKSKMVKPKETGKSKMVKPKEEKEDVTRSGKTKKTAPPQPCVAKCDPNAGDHVRRWFNRALEKGVAGLREEFGQMRRYCPANMTVHNFTINWELGRNRYKDVPCQDKDRVILKWPGYDYDYIHANYVPTPKSPKRYICTQGPLEATAVDFWHMVLQEETQAIIMLCNCIEKNMDKCYQYWPQKPGDSLKFGDVTVISEKATQVPVVDNIVQTNIKIKATPKRGNPIEKAIWHFQWINWPDRGVPPCNHSVIHLLNMVRQCDTSTVVHCSAGIGRTGTIVSIGYMMERFQNAQTCEDMPVIFKEIRNCRPYSIQNDIQYLFIHRVIMFYFAERYRTYDKSDPRYIKFVEDYNQAIM